MRKLISVLVTGIFLFNSLSKADDNIDIAKLDKPKREFVELNNGKEVKKLKLEPYHTAYPWLFYSSPSELMAEINQGMPLFSSNYQISRRPAIKLRKSQAILGMLSDTFAEGNGKFSGALYEFIEAGIEIEDFVYNTKVNVRLLPPAINVYNKREGKDSGVTIGDLKKYRLPWFKDKKKEKGSGESRYSLLRDLMDVDLGINTDKGSSPGDLELTVDLLKFSF